MLPNAPWMHGGAGKDVVLAVRRGPAGRICAIAAVTLLASVLAGCGYIISSRPDGLRGPPKRVYIASVSSLLEPPEPGLDFDFARRLKNEMALDRRFDLSSESGSDLHVSIALVRLREPTLVRDFANQPSEIGLAAEARVRVVEGGAAREFVALASDSYAPGGGEPRGAGLARLWRNLARATLDQLSDEGWGPPEAHR